MHDAAATIANVIRARQGERMHAYALDAEIDRYVAHYESEKTVIDVAHREAIGAAKSEAERKRLWRAYEKRIDGLHAKILKEVEETSVTVLHDVIPAVVPVR